MKYFRSEREKLLLRNDTVARYLSIILQNYEDIRLFAGIQREGDLRSYYFEYLRERNDNPNLINRLICYHLKNNNHYVLTAVDVKKRPVEVLYFDPLGNNKIPAEIAEQYISTFGKVKFRVAKHPQQKDYVNCGVYLSVNAQVVADTEIELAEFEKNPAKYFLNLDKGKIIVAREKLVETLNTEFNNQYALDEDGAIYLAAEQGHLEVPSAPKLGQFVLQANNKIAMLFDDPNAELKPEDFYRLFKAAEEAIKELQNVERVKADENVGGDMLSYSVRFFQSEQARFERELKKSTTPQSSPRKFTSCGDEARQEEEALKPRVVVL